MTFGKRSIVTGFFSKEDIYAPNVNLGGSQLDLAKFEIVRQQMENLNLIEQVARVGKTMQNAADKVKSSKITSIKLVGTQMWINTANGEDAQNLRDHLRRSGVIVKLNGAQGVMARPALTLGDQNVSILSSALSKF